MANDFSSTENNPGLLKNVYDSGGDAMAEALKKKREKLMATKGMVDLDKQAVEPKAES